MIVCGLGWPSVGRGCSDWFRGLNNFHTPLQISSFDFGRPKISRPNFDLRFLGLYENLFESII